MEGLEILKKFDAFEIDSLSVLADAKYYTKSVPYPLKIITVEKWIRVAERLRINRQIRKEYRTNKASKDLATGIIKCGECGQKYYSYTHGNKKNDKAYDYVYYKHYAPMGKIECGQKKSFAVENINEIFRNFYFFFYRVFDDTPELIEESQRMIKVKQAEIRERISQYEKNEKQFGKQIEKFNLALDDTMDTGEIRILARRISEAEENQKSNYEKLSHAKIELEQLNEQYSGNEMTNAYYNVKDRVTAFFKKMNVEEQRDELTKIIRECEVFNQYLLIDTGHVVFLFDMSYKYEFSTSMLDNLDEDDVYKKFFFDYRVLIHGRMTEDEIMAATKELGKREGLLDTVQKAHATSGIEIKPIYLDEEGEPLTRRFVERYLNKLGIRYDTYGVGAVLLCFEVSYSVIFDYSILSKKEMKIIEKTKRNLMGV
jgi:hypothetical protein